MNPKSVENTPVLRGIQAKYVSWERVNNDKAAIAIMHYHNTPLPHPNLSPGQLLFHRLQDHIPTNPKYHKLNHEWLISVSHHEKAQSRQNEKIMKRYNLVLKSPPELTVGTNVLIH